MAANSRHQKELTTFTEDTAYLTIQFADVVIQTTPLPDPTVAKICRRWLLSPSFSLLCDSSLFLAVYHTSRFERTADPPSPKSVCSASAWYITTNIDLGLTSIELSFTIQDGCPSSEGLNPSVHLFPPLPLERRKQDSRKEEESLTRREHVLSTNQNYMRVCAARFLGPELTRQKQLLFEFRWHDGRLCNWSFAAWIPSQKS